MKKINKLTIFTYVTLLLCVILIILNGFKVISIHTYLKSLFLFLISLIIKIFSRKEYLKNSDNKENVKNVLFNLGTALLVYFLAGIVFGYSYNVYSYEIKSIINNLFNLCLIYVFLEYIRFYLILHSNNKKIFYIIVTIIFILIDINYFSFIKSLNNNKDLFIYIFSVILPIVVKNIIVMLIFIKYGIYSCITYQFTFSLFSVFVPILPNLNYYLKFIALILIPLFVYYKINKKSVLMRTKADKKEYLSNIVFVFFTCIMICFIFGVFKYVPLSVASNSMKPYFKRGDFIVYKRIDYKEKQALKIGDIIVFDYNNDTYVHRIVKTSKNNDSYYFTTRGDNNTFNDNGKIKITDVQGKVVFKIPYIGYPSLWFKSLLES